MLTKAGEKVRKPGSIISCFDSIFLLSVKENAIILVCTASAIIVAVSGIFI